MEGTIKEEVILFFDSIEKNREKICILANIEKKSGGIKHE